MVWDTLAWWRNSPFHPHLCYLPEPPGHCLAPLHIHTYHPTPPQGSVTGALKHCREKYKKIQPLWKTVWQFLIKLSIYLYDPAILLIGIYLREIKTNVYRKICTQLFIAALFTSQKEKLKCSSNRWMNEQITVYLYNGTKEHSLKIMYWYM